LKIAIKVKKLHKDAVIPQYMTEGSAGTDVSSVENLVLCPNEHMKIPTGLAFEIPVGWEIQIRSRSGMSCNHLITIPNAPGTIDADYRGEVLVTLHNQGVENYPIHVGDRIAQLVLAEVKQASFHEAKELSDTKRSGGGFGHTGV